MGGWKKHQPGCPCCSGPCTTSFYVTACCSPAVGASVTVKTAGGTVIATATVNSSGDATVNLSGYIGQTLYAFVSYSTTNFNTFTGVLMGNFCGRTYNYDLTPVSDTIGTACGQVIVKTFGCDGVTPYGGITVSLYQSGTTTPIATGTTNATTGVYTFTGLTTGLVYYVKAGPTSRGQAVQTTSTFTLVCSEEADFVFNPTYPFVPTGTSCPASYTLTALTSGGTYQRGCCQQCNPTTLPGLLYLTDTCAYFTQADCTCGCISDSIQITRTSAVTCNSVWAGRSALGDNQRCNGGNFGLNPLARYYYFQCNGSNATLRIIDTSYCQGTISGGYTAYYANTINTTIIVASSSFTCSPLAATFTVPSITLYSQFVGRTVTVPSSTVTVNQ